MRPLKNGAKFERKKEEAHVVHTGNRSLFSILGNPLVGQETDPEIVFFLLTVRGSSCGRLFNDPAASLLASGRLRRLTTRGPRKTFGKITSAFSGVGEVC